MHIISTNTHLIDTISFFFFFFFDLELLKGTGNSDYYG